jgi:hypothetical protein
MNVTRWYKTFAAIAGWKKRRLHDRAEYVGTDFRCFVVNHDALVSWSRKFKFDFYISDDKVSIHEPGLIIHAGWIVAVIRWPFGRRIR